jgi:hypothetical protein
MKNNEIRKEGMKDARKLRMSGVNVKTEGAMIIDTITAIARKLVIEENISGEIKRRLNTKAAAEVGQLKTTREKTALLIKLAELLHPKAEGISFWDPPDCDGCREDRDLLVTVFGEDYKNLPYMNRDGTIRRYDIALARVFAEGGDKGMDAVKVKEAAKQVEADEKSVPESERAQIPMAEKAKFRVEVDKAMAKCIEENMHREDYTPTGITESAVDYKRGIAAWILQEMIDTDAIPSIGFWGRRGSQNRYSVWKMERGKEPKMLHSDHAWSSEERGCRIEKLALDGGRIKAAGSDGKLEFK